MITDAAAKTLVACYRQLRQNDVVGRSKTAYRVTVRQLESLVRLVRGPRQDPFQSDGRARQRQGSVPTAEKIYHFGRERKRSARRDRRGRPRGGGCCGHAERPGEKRPAEDAPESPREARFHRGVASEAAAQEKSKSTIIVQDYTRYRALITTHLRSRATLDGVPGLKRSAVVDWYLKTHADEVGERPRRMPNC